VRYTDNAGYIYWQRKSLFTSTLVVNNMKSVLPLPVSDTYPSPLTLYSNTLFATSSDQLTTYGAVTLIRFTTNTIGSVDTTLAPIVFNNQLFLLTLNGSFVSYSLVFSAPSLSLPLRFYFSPPAAFGPLSLGAPVIAPFGLFVFANLYGILGVDWNGNMKFTITTDRSGTPLRCSAPTAIREGIAYVVCNGQLQMVDVLRGEIWLAGPGFQYGAPTIIVDTSSELSLGVFTIYRSIVSANNLTQLLYQPNQLPPSLNAAPTVVQEQEQNKIWIAGLVVGGAVGLILIVAIAVKVCGDGGEKKDIHYVAMKKSVNQDV